MNTRDDNTSHDEDELSVAMMQSDRGAEAWRAVVRAQAVATPDHIDFYAVAGDMVATLRALEELAQILSRQVASYGDGRVLFDDGLDRDTDSLATPQERLSLAARQISVAGKSIGMATWPANRFWSLIGHIGAEVSR
ncbi:hypothetical protein [Pseudonocardia sp. GCM10023141]|uniref:hypothetical protein n=1 Tax=Pseudonocardia sp. GCM10023141 TaxID=3252653 RepID=UPI00361F8332